MLSFCLLMKGSPGWCIIIIIVIMITMIVISNKQGGQYLAGGRDSCNIKIT